MKPSYGITSKMLKTITSITEKRGVIHANLLDSPEETESKPFTTL
jgi:hypothetical protein